jgi:hypothetical protein
MCSKMGARSTSNQARCYAAMNDKVAAFATYPVGAGIGAQKRGAAVLRYPCSQFRTGAR